MPECFLYETVLISVMELFQIMQIDYPRCPSGAVTKNSINMKMTISQEPLVEIDPFCARMLFV